MLDFINELDQLCYAEEQTQSAPQQPQGNQPQYLTAPQDEASKTVDQRLQEAIMRNSGRALSDTYISDRIAEQRSIEDFQRMKMDILGANTEHREPNYDAQLSELQNQQPGVAQQNQQPQQNQVPTEQKPGQPDVASVQDKLNSAPQNPSYNNTAMQGVPNARQV